MQPGRESRIRAIDFGKINFPAHFVGYKKLHRFDKINFSQNPLFFCPKRTFTPPSTTVSLTLFPYVAARTSIQFSDDVASEHEAQGGDGIGHVTLRSLDAARDVILG